MFAIIMHGKACKNLFPVYKIVPLLHCPTTQIVCSPFLPLIIYVLETLTMLLLSCYKALSSWLTLCCKVKLKNMTTSMVVPVVCPPPPHQMVCAKLCNFASPPATTIPLYWLPYHHMCNYYENCNVTPCEK